MMDSVGIDNRLSADEEHVLSYWLADPPVTIPPSWTAWSEIRRLIRIKLDAANAEIARLRKLADTTELTLRETSLYIQACDAELAALRSASHRQETEGELELLRVIGLAGIPLEALRAVEMDSHWMAPALKRSIIVATDAIRTALTARGKGGS